LDYLPIFVDVRDRAVAVVGGGAVAMRKVEQLLKAQARVCVIAPVLDAGLANLRDAGRIQWRCGDFSPAHLDGAALVVAATDDAAVNAAVAVAARERGIWFNVVDDGANSQFIFPAIVDRSPLIVAVGTAGRSPTLARRVRAQIEALLPQRIGELAEYAGRWRERVKAALPEVSRRLRFWETFFDGPIATRVLAGEAPAQLDTDIDIDATARGEVYLIGVGPGDPDLLTLRAQQLLQQADVLLHDRLVPSQILDRARRDALRIDVGKSPGAHDTTQESINRQLVEWAQRGLRVARVKGGDPFVFGRGGEELAVLREAGIPVTVVPGITAATAAAASALVPLTQRGFSQSVTFVTATGAGSGSLDWAALARPGQTVVFYMGGAQIDTIAAKLAAHGLPPTHPVALIERASWPEERVLPATLGDLSGIARRGQLQSPTLLIVGEVAAFAIARGVKETARLPPV
jgi:uroporphyrin-III C-methyltransferase/precorrin-2 dehydrogenase/sirohydrochlorin ferrochelatase